jgi:hypothetical protein
MAPTNAEIGIMLGAINVFQKQIRHPGPDDHKTILKRHQYLPEINKNAMDGFDLARTIVVALAWFGIHNKTRAFQARLRFCSSNASAVSSPRPPQ